MKRNIRRLIEVNLAEGNRSPLLIPDIRVVCMKAKDVFDRESALLESISGNVLVIGDLHGSIRDLLHILASHKKPSKEIVYLFLGDFIDRGESSIETFIYILSLKIEFPNYVYLVRGNHEFKNMCYSYGFYEECINKYGKKHGEDVFDTISSVFPYLPLAAVVQNKFFAVHGGLSSRVNTLNDIRKIKRKSIIDHSSCDIVTGLVWGDPRNLDNGAITAPSERGAGEDYSEEKVRTFLKTNNLVSIIRAHEPCKTGYNIPFDIQGSSMPLCITIFSASNYCQLDNLGGVALIYEDGTISIEQHSFDDCSNTNRP
jgi:diadenosine tetraphosphatase ApaH/serine/threonine PP2A family protein phosphatase